MRKGMKLWRSAVSLVMAFAMIIGVCQPALAAGAEDDTLSYVSIGASQTNGYGMRYYLPESVYEVPTTANKNELNIFGYQSKVEDAYPNLVKEALEDSTGKTVELEQLAISSMRAEEVHVLLDNDYYGDKYTQWRFLDENGNGWFAQANKEGGFEGLRKEYQEYVANADVISLDIGVNNFGVYTIHQIKTSKFDADLTKVFDEATLATYTEYREKIHALLAAEAGADMADQLDHVVETLTYALVGFMKNFDAVVKHIYELNPDAQIVVVGLGNMMKGLDATYNGVEIPFGKIYGAVIDMANLYTASLSEYADTYAYAYVGEDGSAETFLKDIQEYSGNPADLHVYMEDCFDIYDENTFLRSKIQYAVCSQYTELLTQAGYSLDTSGEIAFINSVQPFLNDGANGYEKFASNPELQAGLKQIYNAYLYLLDEAYDVVCTIASYGAKKTTIDLNVVMDGSAYSKASDECMTYLEESVNATLQKALLPDYTGFEMDTEKFDSDPGLASVLAMAIRCDYGNSFFAHPNIDGHKEIAAAIMSAYENGTKGKDVVKEEIKKEIEALLPLIEEYYDDAYAAAYRYAFDNGYVDDAVELLDTLSAELDELNPSELGLSEELTAELENAIENAQETIAQLQTLIKEADVLDQAALDEVIDLLNKLGQNLTDIREILTQAGIDAGNQLWIVCEEAAAYFENEVKPVIIEKLTEAVEAGTQYILEKLGETYDAFVEAFVAAVKEYVPEADAYLYDWFLNHPHEVFCFFEEYGDEIAEHYEAIGAVIGFVGATFGQEVVDYVMNNPEEALDTFVVWYETYGDKALEMIRVYLEHADTHYGLTEKIKEEIVDKLEAMLDELKAELKALEETLEEALEELKDADAAVRAEIEAKIAAIEAKIAEVEAFIAELEAVLAEIEAKVEALAAAVDALDAAIKEFIEAVESGVTENIQTAIDQIQKAIGQIAEAVDAAKDIAEEINEALDEAQALAERIVNELKEVKEALEEINAEVKEAIVQVEAAIETAEDVVNAIVKEVEAAVSAIDAGIAELVVAFEKAYAESMTAEYVISDDNYYVAMGDVVASEYMAEKPYASLVVETLEADYGYTGEFANLAEAGMSMKGLLASLEDEATVAEIEAADLVTVGFSMKGIMETALVTEDVDWTVYFGEEGAAAIEAAVEEAKAALADGGLPADAAAAFTAIIEALPYTLVEYAANYHKVAEEIHAINEDALVVLVGMYNPLEGAVLDMDGEEFAVGEYLDGFVELSNLHLTACAMLSENTIFVEAEEVETWAEQEAGTTNALEFVLELLDTESDMLHPSDLGHDYIKEQILGALVIEGEPWEGLSGDVNLDGVVDTTDAQAIFNYFMGVEPNPEMIEIRNADINGDGYIDTSDAQAAFNIFMGI